MPSHGCGATWGGINAAHCAACHMTFSGMTHFDNHRAGDHNEGRYCLTPEEMGLEQTRPGVWGTKMTEDEKEKFLASVKKEED